MIDTEEKKTGAKAEPQVSVSPVYPIDLAPLTLDVYQTVSDSGHPYYLKYNRNVLPDHYFEDGVVGFFVPEHGRDRAINRRPSERMPYMGIEATERHEGWHVYIHIAGGIHDERGINNRVKDEMRLYLFPFASY